MRGKLIEIYGWMWFVLAVAMGTASLFVMIAWLGGLAYRALAGD